MKIEKVLNRLKTEAVEASRMMSRSEREEFYNGLHDWAYRQYEETLIESYEPEEEEE